MTERVALVTGCSTGIGRASALALQRAGVITYASARRPETLAELGAAGCRTMALDVTDEAARADAVAAIEREQGRLDVLVNNAGYAEYGPLEEISLERWRREFETNVFGAVRLIQLALPGMRERRTGRIVNMSSMGGLMAFPMGAPYHASKFALEALSDVLRVEVQPFGIDVVVIEPGVIATGYADTASIGLHEAAEGPYGDLARSFLASMASAYRGRGAASPEKVAEVVRRAVTARRPRTRYKVTLNARILPAARGLLPDRAWDTVLRRIFPA
ncbi:MAG: SDR family NAD(P)-dependent oxidoreductase [Actinobacteria bacterium]|nr:SDR family NAD(P)-dependent oxidoreductase [Actinomycetota bacterium]